MKRASRAKCAGDRRIGERPRSGASRTIGTALVLAIAYGRIGLAAYSPASFLLLVREAVPREATSATATLTGDPVEGL